MEKAVLVYVDGILTEKRVFGGDVSDVEKRLSDEGVDYEILGNDDSKFLDAKVGDLKTNG